MWFAEGCPPKDRNKAQLRNAHAVMADNNDASDAKATASLGVLCAKKDLDPALRRDAKKALAELKRRKEVGRGNTWTAIMNTSKSVREKDKVRDELAKDPKLQEAHKMMQKMPVPGKVDIERPERLNFVSMAKKEWQKKCYFSTAAELAAQKKAKWVRRCHPDEPDPYVFDYDGTKEVKRNQRDALLKLEQGEKEEAEYSYSDPLWHLGYNGRLQLKEMDRQLKKNGGDVQKIQDAFHYFQAEEVRRNLADLTPYERDRCDAIAALEHELSDAEIAVEWVEIRGDVIAREAALTFTVERQVALRAAQREAFWFCENEGAVGERRQLIRFTHMARALHPNEAQQAKIQGRANLMMTNGKLLEADIRDWVNAEMRHLLAPAYIGTGGLSRKADRPPAPPPKVAILDDPTKAFEGSGARGFLDKGLDFDDDPSTASPPPRKRVEPAKLKGGFFETAKAKKGGLLGSGGDARDRDPALASIPRGFCKPREADRENENALEFAEGIDVMRKNGVPEVTITQRLKENFERNASPAQKKAAEYGYKLSEEGHSEDYIREKMASYMANVEKLDALGFDDE